MLDRPSGSSNGGRSQRQIARESAKQARSGDSDEGPENAEETLQSYHEPEIREIKMFSEAAGVRPQREQRQKQLRNPYLRPRGAVDRQEERQASAGNAPIAERSEGGVSEQSEISLVDEAVEQGARSKPQTMKNNGRQRNSRNAREATAMPGSRPVAQDTFGTLASGQPAVHDGGERDDGSVGASSSGIRPYTKTRKSSGRASRGAPDQKEPTLSAVQQILASSANARAADEDSFALDVQRVPGSSAKNYTASKSMAKR